MNVKSGSYAHVQRAMTPPRCAGTFPQCGMTLPQSGMTLIEVLVTVSLLGVVMASTLTLYSNIMRTNRQRDALTTMISDADRILSTVEHDIRNAASFMTTYALEDTYTVIAALPRNKNVTNRPQPTVVYALDADRPNRLFRIIVGDDVHATELSAGVKSFSMIPTPDALITVELNLETIVAGEAKTWQASSAFGLK